MKRLVDQGTGIGHPQYNLIEAEDLKRNNKQFRKLVLNIHLDDIEELNTSNGKSPDKLSNKSRTSLTDKEIEEIQSILFKHTKQM